MHSPIIRVEHLSKSVPDPQGELLILSDVNFELQAKETAAIVGASGSGKSTLLSIMAGLDRPSQGTVYLEGQDLFELDEDARAHLRAQRIGFVFQSFQLLGHLTALENVMLPLELMGKPHAKQAAKEMMAQDDRTNNEFYVAPAYSYMINKKQRIGYLNIGSERAGMYGLGIPEDLEYFNSLLDLPV